VGTFKIEGGVKKGGNVATYFCTAEGRVLHAIAGPVDAPTLLADAKWVLATHAKAKEAGKEGEADYVKVVRQAHADWLEQDAKQPQEPAALARRPDPRRPSPAAAVHRLLASHALDTIEQVYGKVWEDILKEKVAFDAR
jgi:hypothetical protein